MDTHSSGDGISGHSRVQELAAQLFAEEREYLLAVAAHNAPSRADAEEALQFALLAFIEHFDPDGGAPPLRWVTLTLKRECWATRERQRLDRRAGQEASDLGEPGFSIESLPCGVADTAKRAALRLDAQAGFAALKPAERQALTLLAVGYSYAEIGELTGWTSRKVQRCLVEGRAALREGRPI